MTLFELVAALDGELVCNKARVRRDGKWVILGQIVGNTWRLTSVGQQLLDAANTVEIPNEPISEPVAPKPTRRTRTPRAETGLG